MKGKEIIMTVRKTIPWMGVALALLLVVLAGSARKSFADAGPPVVEITAKRFAFAPDTIHLKKDQTVRLRLHSDDVTHGFFLRALKIDSEILPGQDTEIEVTPHVAGSFTTICDHFCGANHGNMKMTIVVE
jgi:cytochrome c oxidase subunit II